ncbi:MAG: bifunctional diaminohydroxyphosphoribosylaminopyrimidine deaminase/5-amino-6-(5-phosphoribosylamino)uracil reductase RibD [Peptococcaceae bacterium]
MEEKYMKLALALARKAAGRTSPNPLVGAVIVKNKQIVGQGYHRKAGTLHAERMALREAGAEAAGADLYVTLEPCSHYGRTGPCTEAIIESKIKNVYIAVLDPNPLVAGKGLKRLQEAGMGVQVGLKAQEAAKLNEIFFKYITTKSPFVALKTACSLDGKIATQSGHSQWITGQEARAYGHILRNRYDAVMVGIGTVLADNPALNCRAEGGRDPVRVVVDSNLSISPEAKILNLNSQAPTLIATTEKSPVQKRVRLTEKAEILVVNDGDRVDLKKLLTLLGKKQITGVLVEGGAKLNGELIRHNLIDKFYLFYAPMLIGGQTAPGFAGGEGPKQLAGALKLGDLSMKRLGGDFLITAYPEIK